VQLGERRRRPRWPLKVVLLLLLATAAWISLRVGPPPRLEIVLDRPGIGPRTMVRATAREPRRGLERVALELVQGERVTRLVEREHVPRPAWKLWGKRTVEDTLEATVGGETTEGLENGPARLRLSASRPGTWLRSPAPALHELDVEVRLTPPRVSVQSTQHYPTVGGSEAVVYRLGDGAVNHGVVAGEAFFPGYVLPGGSGEHFALYAVPHDMDPSATIRLIAEDELGNRAERAFVDRLRPREIRRDTIEVGDGFIERVAAEIEAETPSLAATGDLVDRYLAINRDLRVSNRDAIAELAKETAHEFLWQGVFQPMPNGQVMARFADHRTYHYGGSEIDTQDHLGYDLASVQRAAVPAANAGVAVAARYLGIYGNVVVIDHGFGLMSLYGHLSSLEVAVGDRVHRGQTIGRTGATGLAGGDHLHFGVFLHGVATDPVEWLDESWIRNRILAKVAPGNTP
jgi:murein DD-endopeptidase MepM/ murein hydrolase activator NlpD